MTPVYCPVCGGHGEMANCDQDYVCWWCGHEWNEAERQKQALARQRREYDRLHPGRREAAR